MTTARRRSNPSARCSRRSIRRPSRPSTTIGRGGSPSSSERAGKPVSCACNLDARSVIEKGGGMPTGSPPLACPVHGRRPAWLVCEHLAFSCDGIAPVVEHRLVWMYDGTTGATLEYRLCEACARLSTALRRAALGGDSPRDPLHARMRALCSACGQSRLE